MVPLDVTPYVGVLLYRDQFRFAQFVTELVTPLEVIMFAKLWKDEAGFVTGCDYPLDGGFIKLNT